MFNEVQSFAFRGPNPDRVPPVADPWTILYIISFYSENAVHKKTLEIRYYDEIIKHLEPFL